MCETKKTFDLTFHLNHGYSTKYVDFNQITHGNIYFVSFFQNMNQYDMHL